MKLSCIIVDDEPLALNLIKEYVAQVEYLKFEAGFSNPLKALAYLKSHEVDLLFLDIQMSKLTGLQMLQVMKNKPIVILTTAYEKYALKGYELEVLDYLLKPISFERFILAVDKAYEKKANQGEKTAKEQAIISNPKEEFLFVKTGSKLQKIDFDEIIYIEGMSEYLKIVTGAENVMTLQNFAKMGSALPPENFVRVHKSYMVSINKIESIERNRIYIHDHIIPISDTYKEAFFKLLSSKKVL